MSLDSQRLMLFDWENEDWQELARVNASYPSWSSDSKTLYLGAKVNNRQGQYRIGVTDKKLERMVSLPETLHEVVSFALWFGMAPDGSLIVGPRFEPPGNFWLGMADAMMRFSRRIELRRTVDADEGPISDEIIQSCVMSSRSGRNQPATKTLASRLSRA